jgi:cob(I)alamin adenosyltransferase
MAKRSKALHQLAGSGDDGTTGLLGGGRASKDDLRIDVYGTVDEASSALGLAKALTPDAGVKAICEEIQRGLYKLGAELATNPEAGRAFGAMEASDVERLDLLMRELEAQTPMPSAFILPGNTPGSGALDLARTVIRRAERRVVALERAGGLANPEVRRWLNRLSLLVFVLGRHEEARAGVAAKAARGS